MATAITEAQVLEALRTVYDPDLRKDLVTLGMVRDLSIEGDRVAFRIVLTTPACPMKDQMKAEAERVVRALPGVREVAVSMEAQTTGRSMRSGAVPLPNIKNIIAVASNKGGVGKTTVAVNLAVALAATGARTGLLDADITGPNVPIMLGVRGQPPSRGDGLPVAERYDVKLISIAFFLPTDNTPVIWRGPMVSGAIQQMLRDAEWGELDYMIIDLPPGTGDAALTVVQSVPLSGALIVITPQDVALADAYKCIAMFQKLEVPVLGIVENMSAFICPHCGERVDIFGQGGARRAAEQLGLDFLGEIPLIPAVRQGGDAGEPVAVTDSTGPAGRPFHELAGKVAQKISILNAQTQMPSFAGKVIPLIPR